MHATQPCPVANERTHARTHARIGGEQRRGQFRIITNICYYYRKHDIPRDDILDIPSTFLQ